MNEIPDLNAPRHSIIRRFFRWLTSRRIMRRLLIIVAVIITLIALFYAKANRRGTRLWEICKREMAARGESLEWSAFVPAPVPDDQNIFKAPKMIDCFGDNRPILSAPLDHPVTNALARLLNDPKTPLYITNTWMAERYLSWSDPFQPEFDAISAGLQRPYSRMIAPGSQPLTMQFPNAVGWDAVVRTVTQRAKSHLVLGQTDKAWQDLTLLHDLRRLVECQGKLITTEVAWLDREDILHSLTAVAQGLELHAWSEPQLRVLQGQLKDTDCLTQFADALRCGRALLLSSTQSGDFFKAQFAVAHGSFWTRTKQRTFALLFRLEPRGEIYETSANRARDWQKLIDAVSTPDGMVHPAEATKAFSPWTGALNGLPRLLWTQTRVNEGQLACALERYRLAHGKYPDTLDALVPQFIEQLPHDLINGESLKYHPTANGSFQLYSVGWNETDDGGQAIPYLGRGPEYLKMGDWLW